MQADLLHSDLYAAFADADAVIHTAGIVDLTSDEARMTVKEAGPMKGCAGGPAPGK